MTEISATLVKTLREKTGAGIMACRTTLAETGGDLDAAIERLRDAQTTMAAKKADREATEGLVALAVEGRRGAIVEVNCETDFVARTEQFQKLVRDLAVQVAATYPKYVSVEAIPAETLEAKRQELLSADDVKSKPEDVRGKIVDGRLKKWFAEPGGVLLEQPFRDEERPVRDLITEAIATIGENIQVRRFERFALGEDK